MNKAVKEIAQAADFYHSMDLDPEESYWFTMFNAACDITDRLLNLESNTTIDTHLATCEWCKENGR